MDRHDQTVDRVRAALAGVELEWLAPRDGMPALAVARALLRETLERLKRRAGFESATFVTAIDNLGSERRAGTRFELVHQLFSLVHGDRVRLHTGLDERAPSAPTCVDLWPGAAFMERECFDMFGIVFARHPDLRRLLMPDEYGHHPLRRDFPHQGIEPDRLYRRWERERRAAWERERAGSGR